MHYKKTKAATYSAVVYMVFSLFIFLYLYSDYQKKKLVAVEQIQSESTRQLAYTHNEFNELSIRISNTLELLADSRPLYDYFIHPSERVTNTVESSWLKLVALEKFFSRLELIDDEGNYLFSIVYSNDNKQAVKQLPTSLSVNHSLLDKLTLLPKGQAFSEGVRLNEALAVSGVYEPLMQVAIPIDISGKRKGYILAELNASIIINVVKFSPTLSISPAMINQDGYYLLSDDNQNMLGHLVSERVGKTLKIQKPALWSVMSKQKEGSLSLDDGIYSFYRFDMEKEIPNKKMYFLLYYPTYEVNVLFELIRVEIMEEAAIIFLLLSLVVIPFGILLSFWDNSNLESQLAKSALEGMSAVVITDRHRRILKVNPAFTSISGFSASEVIGKNTFDVLLSESENIDKRLTTWKQVEELGAWQGELDVLSKNKRKLSLLVRIQSVKSKRKATQYYIISYIDITKRKELEKELRYLSEKDVLSGCWNRRKFEFELENQTLLTQRYYPAHRCCLAILDIDLFKRINDTKGHDVGDQVIRLVSDILNNGSRETDFVARIGGEEFAIIMPHTTLMDAEMVINRLRVAVSQLEEYHVTISGGLTDLGHSKKDAYKCADLALYESKTNGRNQVSICSSLEDLA